MHPNLDEASTLKRSLFIFLSCFLLSVLLGAVLSNLFSGDRLRKVILSMLDKGMPGIEWELDDVKVQLSDGLLPIVAVKFNALTVRKFGECGKRIHIRGQSGSIPLQWSSLFRGPIKLGKIKFQEITIYEVPGLTQRCEGKDTAAVPAAVPPTEPLETSVASVHEPVAEAPWTSIELNNIHILNPDGAEQSQIRNLSAKWDETGMTFDARLILKQLELDGVSSFRVSGHLESNFDALSYTVFWREGTLSGTAKNLKSAHIVADMRANKISADETYKTLRSLKIVKNELTIGPNWIDFTAHYEAKPKKQISFSDFSLSGDIGEARIETARLLLEPTLQISPFKARLKKIKLGEVVKVLAVEPVQRITSQQGEFTGELQYSGTHISTEGLLENIVAVFSRDNRKAFQKVMSAHLQCEYDLKGLLSGEIDKIVLDAGEWLGSVKAKASFAQATAEVGVQFQKLALNPQVAQALYGIQLGAISGAGNLHLVDGKIKYMQGQLSVDRIVGKGYGLNDMALAFNYQDLKGSGTFQATDFHFEPETLGISLPSSIWTRISGPLRFENSTYLIGPLRFLAQGVGSGAVTVNYKDALAGLLELGTQKRSWIIQGSLEKVELTPRN